MDSVSESPIVGIVISSFTDSGPQVLFNSAVSYITEDQALNLSIRIMTLIGESTNNEMFGPLPIPSNDSYLCLAYSFLVESTYTIDPRLRERPTVICIIFKRTLKRDISRAHGLLLTYLSQVTSKDFTTEEDLKPSKMSEIHKRLSALISSNPIRIYTIENNMIREYMGSLDIPTDAFIVVDLQKQILYIVFDENLSPLKKRQTILLVDELNEKNYRRRLNKQIVDSSEAATRLLNFYGLKHRKEYQN